MRDFITMAPEEQVKHLGITLSNMKRYTTSFKSGRDTVTMLTVEAINDFAHRLDISIESVEVLSEDKEQITVKAVACQGGLRRHVGIVRQSKLERSGKTKQFAIENAVSKAQRNAKQGLLPMPILKEMMDQASDPNYDANADANARLNKAREVYAADQATIKGQEEKIDNLEHEVASMRETIRIQKEAVDGITVPEEDQFVEHMSDDEVIAHNDESAVSANLDADDLKDVL